MFSTGVEVFFGLLLLGSVLVTLWRQLLVLLLAAVLAVFAVGVDGVWEMLAR